MLITLAVLCAFLALCGETRAVTAKFAQQHAKIRDAIQIQTEFVICATFCVLCASAVKSLTQSLTAETQSALRWRRELNYDAAKDNVSLRLVVITE